MLGLAIVNPCAAFSATPLRLPSSTPFQTVCIAPAKTRLVVPERFALCAEPSGGDAVDEAYYSVAAIRGKQAVSNAARGGMYEVYYLVQWEGFDESQNTWELAESLNTDNDPTITAMISGFENAERQKSGGVFGSLMKSTAAMTDAYKQKLNPVVGPEAFKRNRKATEDWTKQVGGIAKEILDSTDPIIKKKD